MATFRPKLPYGDNVTFFKEEGEMCDLCSKWTVLMCVMLSEGVMKVCQGCTNNLFKQATAHIIKITPRTLGQSLLTAIRHGDYDSANRLLTEGADPRVEDNLPIRLAARKGDLMMVKLLLSDRRVNPAACHNDAIRGAAANSNYHNGNHLDVVCLLLTLPSVDPGDMDNAAIRDAVWYGHTDVVETLLADPRVDPSSCINRAIVNAAWRGHVEIVKLLLADPRVDPLVDDCTPLRRALESKRTEVAKILINDMRVITWFTTKASPAYDRLLNAAITATH